MCLQMLFGDEKKFVVVDAHKKLKLCMAVELHTPVEEIKQQKMHCSANSDKFSC